MYTVYNMTMKQYSYSYNENISTVHITNNYTMHCNHTC